MVSDPAGGFGKHRCIPEESLSDTIADCCSCGRLDHWLYSRKYKPDKMINLDPYQLDVPITVTVIYGFFRGHPLHTLLGEKLSSD